MHHKQAGLMPSLQSGTSAHAAQERVRLTVSSARRILSGLRSALTAAVLLGTSVIAMAQTDRFADQRDMMVTTAIEAEGISSPAVLKAMRSVPRHEFVPPGMKNQAYADVALPIGSQQTISPPFVVAYMTEELDPQPGDRVLEIGTGSGYQAAVLSTIVSEVYTVEIVSALAVSARRRLKDLGYDNVHVKDGDGYEGWAEHAPFDRIIVTCSPESVPQPLVDQLKDGGKMIIPVGERYQQSFVLLEKKGGVLEQRKLISTLFVPMTGQSEDERRELPDPLNPVIVNGSFEADENQDGRADGWHYQRKATLCTDGPTDGKQFLRFENSVPGELSQALQGTAIDGRQIAALYLNYWVQFDGVRHGPAPADQASLVVHFYDSVRREIRSQVVGRWRGSLEWQNARSTIVVPANAKEMIIRIGLNGATGRLDIDNLSLTTGRR